MDRNVHSNKLRPAGSVDNFYLVVILSKLSLVLHEWEYTVSDADLNIDSSHFGELGL